MSLLIGGMIQFKLIQGYTGYKEPPVLRVQLSLDRFYLNNVNKYKNRDGFTIHLCVRELFVELDGSISSSISQCIVTSSSCRGQDTVTAVSATPTGRSEVIEMTILSSDLYPGSVL